MEVTEENVPVLQFLDCLKDIDKCAEEDLEVCGKVLTAYAEEHVMRELITFMKMN